MQTRLMRSLAGAAGLLALTVVPAAAQHAGGHSGGHRSAGHAGAAAGHTRERPAGRPVTGHAVPRTSVAPHVDRRGPVVHTFRSHVGVGLGLGLGAYGYAGRSPYGYGYPGYYSGYPSTAYGYGRSTHARLRILDAPRHAQVYVDGYYAGIVDDFDGVFQHLELTPGPHRIEIAAVGFAPVTFDVQAQGGRTLTYRTRMTPYRP